MFSKKDMKILEILKSNCKLTTREISEKTGIPVTTVHNRIKKLESEGVITGYKATINDKKIGKNIGAYIYITIDYKTPDGSQVSQEDIAKKIFMMPEVDECCILTGAFDIIIKVSTTDVDQLNDFVINKLRNIGHVEKTQTAIILRNIKDITRKITPIID